MKKYFIFFIFTDNEGNQGFGNAILKYKKIENEKDIKDITKEILNVNKENYNDVILQNFILLN